MHDAHAISVQESALMSFLRRVLFAVGLSAGVSSNSAGSKVTDDVVAAANWIAKALTSSGYKADFSIDSLLEVDRFFEEQAPGGIPKPDGLLGKDLGARMFALGGYVGEVIRRAAGGKWQGEDQDPRAEIDIALKLDNGTILWPVQRVMKRFRNGTEDALHAYGIAATR